MDFCSNFVRILDETKDGKHIGSEFLRLKVLEIKPKLHIFGHVHEAAGIIHQDGITYVNASSMGKEGILSNDPVIIPMSKYFQTEEKN